MSHYTKAEYNGEHDPDKKKVRWIIKDWAGNVKFKGKTFKSMDEASGFLSDYIEKTYPETKEDEKRFYEEKDEYFYDEV